MEDLALLGALGNAVRRRLYAYVCDAGKPVGRAEAAAATGIGRPLAAYHLEQLARRGLVEVEYARPEGRTGRGAGRPAKLYRRAEREFVLRAPPRDYRLLAELLARAIEARDRTAMAEVARGIGRDRTDSGLDVEDTLRAHGYEPLEAGRGRLRLRNCPFDAVAKECPELVCGLNLAFLEGLLERHCARAVLVPRPGMCCVEVEL